MEDHTCTPGVRVRGHDKAACFLTLNRHDSDRMVLGCTALAVYIRERESAFMFFDPGCYNTVKLNLVKKSAHVACWRWRYFEVRRYSIFFSLVNTGTAPSSQCLYSSRTSLTSRIFKSISMKKKIPQDAIFTFPWNALRELLPLQSPMHPPLQWIVCLGLGVRGWEQKWNLLWAG